MTLPTLAAAALLRHPATPSRLLRLIAPRQVLSSSSSIGRPYNAVVARASSSSSSSSSFQAPVPPSSQGHAVYTDIDMTNVSSESFKRNNDRDAVFVVTGASRGIGLQLVKSLRGRTKGRIIACCRTVTEDIQELSLSDSSRIHIISLDVEEESSVEHLAHVIKKSYDGRVDVLFNVAGILGDSGVTTPGPERSLSKIDAAWLDKTMRVNLIGPVLLCQHLSPYMKVTTTTTRAKSIIVNMSARVGSISDNRLGGWYSYRMSKCALNMATRTMAHELKRQNTWAIALHPGTTDTNLSKPFQKNVQRDRLFPVDFTVAQLLTVLDAMDDTHSGGLFDWAGKAIPF